MKKLFIIILCLVSIATQSQPFEGTVKWSMKMEITDPKIKAQMEQTGKQMSDPANQARMKQMLEKMNDPQMKAMMDANPQMKAQMENAMKMMQGGGMASMMPSSFTFKTKGGNTLTTMTGGIMPMDVLHLKAEDKTYFLNRSEKTYFTSQQMQHNNQGEDKTKADAIKVTKTSETMQILNHTCTKYIVKDTKNGHETTTNFWTTTEIKDFDMKSLTKHSVGDGNQQLYYENIDGVPLRIETGTPQGTMTMQVTDIKRESLSASEFVVPSDFTEKKGMFGQK
jgi:Domain of unknown function (DUF4412)